MSHYVMGSESTMGADFGEDYLVGPPLPRDLAIKKVQGIVGVTPDGQYGPVTANAVAAWQKKNGLAGDGVVGPITWKAMNLNYNGMPTLVAAKPTPKPVAPAPKPTLIQKAKQAGWGWFLGLGIAGALAYEVFKKKK